MFSEVYNREMCQHVSVVLTTLLTKYARIAVYILYIYIYIYIYYSNVVDDKEIVIINLLMTQFHYII